MTAEETRLIRCVVAHVSRGARVDRSEQESIVQEVICRIVEYGRPVKNFKAWVFACAMNFVRHRYNKRKMFQKHAPRLYRAEDKNTPVAELARREMADAIDSMLASLNPSQRRSVELWLRKRRGERVRKARGKDRAAVFRAFAKFRKRFPEAKAFLD